MLDLFTVQCLPPSALVTPPPRCIHLQNEVVASFPKATAASLPPVTPACFSACPANPLRRHHHHDTHTRAAPPPEHTSPV
jgi:hypothetical protein